MTTQRNITIGDTVMYFFRSRLVGMPVGRPAIVTSIGPDATPVRRLNLHVFFEPNDREIRRTPVKSSMGVREEMIEQDMTAARMDVPEITLGAITDAVTSVWVARGSS